MQLATKIPVAGSLGLLGEEGALGISVVSSYPPSDFSTEISYSNPTIAGSSSDCTFLLTGLKSNVFANQGPCWK